MTAGLEGLARCVVQCRNWRWMPGMLVTSMGRVIEVDGDLVSAFEHPWTDGQFEFRKLDPNRSHVPDLPDLADPATLGCLLVLVREAWGSPVAQVSPALPDGDTWTCFVNDWKTEQSFRAKTEAEALVLALVLAP